jgi:hypothetical protein
MDRKLMISDLKLYENQRLFAFELALIAHQPYKIRRGILRKADLINKILVVLS